MKILAIETSCDETALALIKANGGLRAPKFRVLKSIISSQIAIHRPWGGVVPNLAKREHIKNLPIVFRQIFSNSKLEIRNSKFVPDLLAVTVGPGLEPALWTGVEFAKNLKKNVFLKIPLIGANHLEGHLYSFLLTDNFLRRKSAKSGYSGGPATMPRGASGWPAIALIVSGGHTILLKVDSLTKWKKLGETRDDAVGEAFDKVAKMMNLPYPGGPEIQKLAAQGNSEAINFPRPMIYDKSYDFSFSGLKTSVLYYLRDNLSTNNKSDTNIRISKFVKDSLLADIAASFKKAAVDVLVAKTIRAAKEYEAKSVILSGGVAANAFLRETLGNAVKEIGRKFLVPPMDFNTDNAVMIAAAAYIQHLRKKNRRIAAQANLSI